MQQEIQNKKINWKLIIGMFLGWYIIGGAVSLLSLSIGSEFINNNGGAIFAFEIIIFLVYILLIYGLSKKTVTSTSKNLFISLGLVFISCFAVIFFALSLGKLANEGLLINVNILRFLFNCCYAHPFTSVLFFIRM